MAINGKIAPELEPCCLAGVFFAAVMLRCNFELMNVVLTVLLSEKDSLFRVSNFSVSFCPVQMHRCNAAEKWREATKKICPNQ
jgi:hypothetical protein